MSNEPLYKRIPEEDKIPAPSKRHPGAISGAALDKTTKKVSGLSDFEPVEMTEEDYIRAYQKAEEKKYIILLLIDAFSPVLSRLWDEKAMPALRDKVFPTVSEKIKGYGDAIVRKVKEINIFHPTHGKRSKGFEHNSKELGKEIILVVPSGFDTAYKEYVSNMTSEEAQKNLLEAFIYQYLFLKKVQEISQAKIIDSSGNEIDGGEITRRLADPSVLMSVNQMLSEKPTLLQECQLITLQNAVGRVLVKDNCFIPLTVSELLPETN